MKKFMNSNGKGISKNTKEEIKIQLKRALENYDVKIKVLKDADFGWFDVNVTFLDKETISYFLLRKLYEITGDEFITVYKIGGNIKLTLVIPQ